MIKKLGGSLPSNTISYMLICGGIIVLVVLLVLLPFYRYNSSKAAEVDRLQSAIDEQKGLGKVHQMLAGAAGKNDVHTLPNPAASRLPRQDVEKFQDAFRAEAGKAGLMTMTLMPDVKSIAPGSPHLLYNAALKGEFAGMRKMLTGLGAMPYIEQIEEIDIRQLGDSMELKMKMRIALAD
ncbi:MAG: hypothetical protein PHG54_05530 [Smithellaceae bacterium]|nr:hypothetical protein [Syntrophaceae bacterium]MDD4240873.1 hypothetical protein [Smithellaceae bacterium]